MTPEVTKGLLDIRERLRMYLDKPTDLRLFLLTDCHAIVDGLLYRPAVVTAPVVNKTSIPTQARRGRTRLSLRMGFRAARVVMALATQPAPAKGMTASELQKAVEGSHSGCKEAIDSLLKRQFVTSVPDSKPTRYGVTEAGLAALEAAMKRAALNKSPRDPDSPFR